MKGEYSLAKDHNLVDQFVFSKCFPLLSDLVADEKLSKSLDEFKHEQLLAVAGLAALYVPHCS
jgi:hypothetical protein